MAKGIKTGGRQKGTSNKLTGTVKEMLCQYVTNELQHLPTLLNKLEPKEKAELLVKFLPYIIPKATIADEEEQTYAEKQSAFVNGIIEKIMESRKDSPNLYC